MAANNEWKTHINWNVGSKKLKIPSPTIEHPLKCLVVTERIPRRILNSQSSTGRTTPVSLGTPSSILEPLSKALEGLDPLSAFQEMDPLSKMVAEMDVSPTEPNSKKEKVNDDKKRLDSEIRTDKWAKRRNSILVKFTTSEKISIVTSFLSEGDKVIQKAQSTLVDKVQSRLEQLDYFEEGSQRKLELSQSEYVSRIDLLNKELILAWNTEQRVKSLKIAIQCSKLLADTDVLSFYPSKFVLVSDILDTFGQLVYDRLRTKANYIRPGTKVVVPLPEDFTPDMVPEDARETCLNWFYKIASIRELVPRIYIEMALLKSYHFISLNEGEQALYRICDMIHGIGNPLVAIYARCYLCRVGFNLSLENANTNYIFRNFSAFLDTYHHLYSRNVKKTLKDKNITMSAYLTLFTPALDFILEGVTFNANDYILNNLIEQCKKQGNSSLILNSIMSAFKPSYVAENTLQFLEMINTSQDEGIPVYILLRTLGLALSICPPPSEHRKQVLGTVWREISSLGDPAQYMTCAEAWIPYVVKHFTIRELNTVLGDLINHIYPNYELFSQQLKLIIINIVNSINDLEYLLIMDNFLPLLDLFQEEPVKVETCKHILTSFTLKIQNVNDPVITNAVLFLCSILHDSVNALTPEDELKQIGQILCNIVRKIDYGRDFESQLSFYVEARASFSNVDSVLVQLVQCVNSLAVKTQNMVQGVHNKKSGDFVRACAAYCFITIPSIVSVKTRLELYLLSGQVALFNLCLGQADACFKAILNIIPELQDDCQFKNEQFLVNFVKQFLSILLVTPDNPESGVLSLLRNLLNMLRSYNWDNENTSLVNVYLSVLDVLSSMSQENLPYHVHKVESNDSLYGSDPKFISEVNKMCTIILGEILNKLKEFGPSRKQATISLELFARIKSRCDPNAAHLNTLAANLWNLSSNSGFVDPKLLSITKEYYQARSNN